MPIRTELEQSYNRLVVKYGKIPAQEAVRKLYLKIKAEQRIEQIMYAREREIKRMGD